MPSRRVLVLALAGIGALLCGVLFFQRDTATSSSLRSDASPAPIAAAYMGGGWRAMFACAGLTRALQRAGLFGPEHVDQLQVLSGNSGGAWFLTQLTYSEAFYENVTGTDHTIQKLVLDWMDKQRPQLQPPSAEVVANFTTWFGPGTLGTLLFVNVFTMLDVFRAHPALTYLFCATITDNTANCEFLISALVGGLSLGAETEGSWCARQPFARPRMQRARECAMSAGPGEHDCSAHAWMRGNTPPRRTPAPSPTSSAFGPAGTS